VQYLYHKEAGLSTLELNREQHNYIFKVRRHRADDKIYLRNLRDDILYSYEVESINRRDSTLRLTSHKEYIVSVINHGSNQFNFPGGTMEGGFALSSDAEDIACFVLEFSNKKCKKAYNKNASLLYTSNCAGCHGQNGKGINGTYPNLRKEKLLGIEKREEFLKLLKKRGK
jgi:cytochrome c553